MEKGKENDKADLCVRFYFLPFLGDLGDLFVFIFFF